MKAQADSKSFNIPIIRSQSWWSCLWFDPWCRKLINPLSIGTTTKSQSSPSSTNRLIPFMKFWLRRTCRCWSTSRHMLAPNIDRYNLHIIQIMNEVIDVYLTPRFWKGELIYDGRRPLLVYQQPVHRPHIDDTKPYPPSYTRKLEPSDGLLYQLSQLKNVKQTNTGIKMLVCVTMYNERTSSF